MIGGILAIVLILLKFGWEIFLLWKEKDSQAAEQRKEAINEGIKILAESKFENLPEDRRRITLAFAVNKRLRK